MSRAGLNADADLFSKLSDAYNERHRYYHDASHISACLTLLEAVRSHCEHPGEVALAVWFHDAVYDPRRPDNEELSAEMATHSLRGNPESLGRIASMILATKSHVPMGNDQRLMIDIDLSILGAGREDFDAYDDAIRKEYFWVPEHAYEEARVRVLQSFLDREQIYLTEPFKHLDAPARQNLQRRVRVTPR